MAFPLAVRAKDPDATIDHTFDWSLWLNGDIITASDWIPPAGITLVARTFGSQTATVWLSGGSAGTAYDVTNRITTAAGRTEDRTLRVSVDQR